MSTKKKKKPKFKKKIQKKVRLSKNFHYLEYNHPFKKGGKARHYYAFNKMCPHKIAKDFIDGKFDEEELRRLVDKRRTKKKVSAKKRAAAENAVDPWIIDKCAENIGFFASIFLDEHITKPFGRFHHILLHDLHQLAMQNKDSNSKGLRSNTKEDSSSTSDNNHYVKYPQREDSNSNDFKQLGSIPKRKERKEEQEHKEGEGVDKNPLKPDTYDGGGGDADASAHTHMSLDTQFFEQILPNSPFPNDNQDLSKTSIKEFKDFYENLESRDKVWIEGDDERSRGLSSGAVQQKDVVQFSSSEGGDRVSVTSGGGSSKSMGVGVEKKEDGVKRCWRCKRPRKRMYYCDKCHGLYQRIQRGEESKDKWILGDCPLCGLKKDWEREYCRRCWKAKTKAYQTESEYELDVLRKDPYAEPVPLSRLRIEKMLEIDRDWEVLPIENEYAMATPRSHGKTTILSFIFVVWLMCFRMYKFIVLVSDSEDQAKLNLEAIRLEIESNEKIRAVFGNMEGERIWGDLALETATGIRVQVRGAGQRIRGLKYRNERPGMIVIDDLENDQNVETEDQRRKLKRWFHGALLPARSFEGKVAYCGTILHEDSLLKEMLDAWPSRTFKIQEEEKILWPSVWTKEKIAQLEEKYRQSGEIDVFYREYYNEIVSPGDAPFQRDYFRYVKVEDILLRAERGESFKTFITIDPAYTVQARSDYSAISVCLTDDEDVMYMVEFIRGRWDPYRLLNVFFELFKKHSPDKVGMQKNDWNRVFERVFRTEMRRRKVFFNMTSLQSYSPKIKGLQSKNNRILRLSPRYSAGMVKHIQNGPGIAEYERELLSFPRGKHDDLIDSASMQLDLIFPASKPKSPKVFFDEPSDEFSQISGY